MDHRLAPGRYCLLAALSGALWGAIAYFIGGRDFPSLWGGILLSPAIGLLVGLCHLPTYRLPLVLRVLLALVTLYAAAALFGLLVGATDALTRSIPNRIGTAVVVEWVLVILWGVTFTGYVAVLWPLAFANHWLLGRVLGHRQSV